MKWLKIDKDDLPGKKVLAANFTPRTYGYKEKIMGYLSLDTGDIVCENESEVLGGCTHYIDLDKFDIEESRRITK